MPEVKERVKWVLDLSADFRLKDPALYPQWYGAEHTAPELLAEFAYGLPELFRDELAGASGVAVPGCYPTAASLALAPLVRAGAVETTGIIVDAASGVSGAGRAPQAHDPLLHGRRGLRRLRPARPPAHAGDGAGRSAPRSCSPRTWPR